MSNAVDFHVTVLIDDTIGVVEIDGEGYVVNDKVFLGIFLSL